VVLNHDNWSIFFFLVCNLSGDARIYVSQLALMAWQRYDGSGKAQRQDRVYFEKYLKIKALALGF
jgi:hypothetical protein